MLSLLPPIRILVTPCAHLLVNCLRQSFGDIRLSYVPGGTAFGEIGWHPPGQPSPDDMVVIGETDGCQMLVDRAHVAQLAGHSMIIEAAFGDDPLHQVFTEMRLIGLLREQADAESDLADASLWFDSRQKAEQVIRSLQAGGLAR